MPKERTDETSWTTGSIKTAKNRNSGVGAFLYTLVVIIVSAITMALVIEHEVKTDSTEKDGFYVFFIWVFSLPIIVVFGGLSFKLYGVANKQAGVLGKMIVLILHVIFLTLLVGCILLIVFN